MTWLVAILLMIGVCLLSNLIMWVKFQNNYNHLIRIERDLNDVKNYLEHRAISESLIKGIGDIGSPWKLRPELVDKYDKFQDELRSFYQKLIENGTIDENDMDDRCLFWEIARRFHDRFCTTICTDNNITSEEAILGACYIAKGNQPVRILDKDIVSGDEPC